jgi:serine/threonine protein kinase
VAAGIEYLHQQRLVHGNLKPQNILITEHGVKILDVLTTQIDPPIVVEPSAAAEKTLTSHIAARFGGYEAPESAILDALAYLGPEQLRVPPHDEVRSDIYAMGALCFYMLTGDPMFPGVTPEEMLARKLKGTTPALDNLRPDAPRDLCDAITQTLANDPSSRYPSTTLLLRTIDRELEGLSSAKSKGNEDQESPRSSASPRTSPAEQTRKQLEDMGLVRPAEWEKAAEQAGSTTNLARILTELMGMRSLHTWRVEGGSPPILTRFQVDWINANQTAKLRLRDYLLRERLSEDGMVTVDRALNVRRERIDILHSFPRMHGRNRDKMLETLAILKSLDHPSIGRLYEHFREDPFDVLAVEYIEGQNLRAHMEANYTSRGRTHAWRAAVEWGISLAEALATAHSSGIRHGNLSPAKVMVTYSGAVKILAMGFGQLFFFSRGNPYASPPAVMAPEQWLDSTEITPASDLYQLGCTLHYLLTGRMPFQGKSLTELRLGHMERSPVRISTSRPDVPEALDQIVGRLLAKSPQERYPDAAAIVADLKAVRGEDTAKPTPVITAPKPEIPPAILPPAPTSDGPTLVSLFVALVLIATLILGIVYFLD